MVRQHGEKIAVGIDAKDGFVAVKGWVEVTALGAVDFAARLALAGVRTLIYTDIATDGMLRGPNFTALEVMLAGTTAAVIASGGVSCREDILRLRELSSRYGNLDGAIVGKALYEKRVTLKEIKE
jgi:phosphoribosylformimino-5-aminoimidazole carboxamide ribotide isomerase